MTIKTDRSRILSYQSCPRRRYIEYHYQGKGIRANYVNIPLTVGSGVHKGLEELLNFAKSNMIGVAIVDTCVYKALDDYDKECKSRSFSQEDLDTSFTYLENRALIEAEIRLYAKVQLPRLLERFEVLEVEKEIELALVSGIEDCGYCQGKGYIDIKNGQAGCGMCKFTGKRDNGNSLVLMSRPDAILRERSTGSIYVLSFKTSSAWMGELSEQQNKWDVQGISELVATEYWLVEQRHIMNNRRVDPNDSEYMQVDNTEDRVAGIKMEYLIKGKYSKADNAQPLMNINKGQRYYSNVLIHPYANIKQWGMGSELVDLRFLYKWQDELGANRQLDYRTWKPCNIWELGEGAIKDWIEFIASSEEGMRVLERMVVTPMEYYRNEEDVSEWLESTTFQELRVADDLKVVLDCETTKSKDRVNRELAERFPKYRHSCFSYNSVCQFAGICWENQEPVQLLASGEMKVREANHSGEEL